MANTKHVSVTIEGISALQVINKEMTTGPENYFHILDFIGWNLTEHKFCISFTTKGHWGEKVFELAKKYPELRIFMTENDPYMPCRFEVEFFNGEVACFQETAGFEEYYGCPEPEACDEPHTEESNLTPDELNGSDPFGVDEPATINLTM
ncbi:hypothetical protein LFL96_25735 [Paraburkholderia sp. D15]|uniref:hypothetical protein n=1 Tax=Paraburkholderia sp. D15 TaxID=2880218 RepID=UPI0024791D0C|nr:hypothetical protein [Paraburkholderia sp. D15]WGS54417.1 hypothetical protein LFL96_25735 [Paraburkholderia sp. D15]